MSEDEVGRRRLTLLLPLCRFNVEGLYIAVQAVLALAAGCTADKV